jgi:hypothetical protein
MKIKGVIEITSYEYTAFQLMALCRSIELDDDAKITVLPLTTPDGLPNHVQVIVFDARTL